jgi:pyridoxal phosphate enzyme (YggS family)
VSALTERLARVRERIAAAEARAGRPPGATTLVAIGKTHPASLLREAVEGGVVVLGENRVQEALAKASDVPGAQWHLVGPLQRNKARRAVELFSMIETLDSLPLAERLDRLGQERGVPVEVLVQVNLSRETSKAGVLTEDLPALLDGCAERDGLQVLGLMTIPAPPGRPEESRPEFVRLRELARTESDRGRPRIDLRHLSMGMTEDFEVAIEEGATLVRVGRAIFGPRGR